MQQRKYALFVFAGILAIALAASARADVKLPHVFGSHMVVQRDAKLPVWGWADAGEKVTVQLGDGATVSTTASDDGAWRVMLPPVPAGGPMTMTVTGKNTITLDDVLTGEVWVCSGQSNMQWTVSSSLNPQEEIAAAKYPQIRLLTIPRKLSPVPVSDVEAEWQVCAPETIPGFSACAYYFGRHLHKELGVPVGLINTSWGGTRIEPWTPPVGFEAVPKLEAIHKEALLRDPKSDAYKGRLEAYLKQGEAWIAGARKAMAEETILAPMPEYPKELLPIQNQQQPVALYNGMIHALAPFAIRGAIWYQGESNHREGMLYTEKMKALIGGWRTVWGQGDFPFYYVQICPYIYGNENPYILPEFWEAQAAALTIPNTGMVVAGDIGNLQDIHPKNKQEVGRRLALWALAKDYGKKDLVYSGPMFQAMDIEGDKIRIRFDHVGGGLASRDGKPLDWFEIIGKETDFTKANAAIDGETVVVSAPEVKDPVAVRFAWHKTAEPNLMNKEGLPAVPFQAGEVPVRDLLALKIAEAKDYELVYDLDIAKADKDVTYDVDRRAQIAGKFDRIAYFLELQKEGEATQYAYVSMDAFTDDLSKIGVPTVASKAVFQQKVANMNVISNVEGIVNDAGLKGGNIEFWPHNYGPPNTANIPNASSELWDFGDQLADPVDGYGSMQVHNYEAKQTIFAINKWKGGASADVGIGNSPGKTRDWTFVSNGNQFIVKRLRVLVRVKK
ncbi:MAG: sialate O-acetylesterase [Planctomycetota bacterium]